MSRRTGVELIAMLVLLSLVSVALADPKQGPCDITSELNNISTIECDESQPGGCQGTWTINWSQGACRKRSGNCEDFANWPLKTVYSAAAEQGTACSFLSSEGEIYWSCNHDPDSEQEIPGGSMCQ